MIIYRLLSTNTRISNLVCRVENFPDKKTLRKVDPIIR